MKILLILSEAGFQISGPYGIENRNILSSVCISIIRIGKEQLRASKTSPSDLDSVDLLIVGSPTQGFQATKPVQAFIEGISGEALKGIRTAVFDTRMPADDVGEGLRFIMKMGGYAAPRVAEALKKKGAHLADPPEAFFVKDKEGPIKERELERAAKWASRINSAK